MIVNDPVLVLPAASRKQPTTIFAPSTADNENVVVAGVGTGGTVMGTGRYLRSRYPGLRVHPMEPAESPTLATG